MARPSKDKLAKRQKEIERKRKAEEKMARRHEKKNKPVESDMSVADDLSHSSRPMTNNPLPSPADGPQGSLEFRHEKEDNEF